jgi:hypothetical protein
MKIYLVKRKNTNVRWFDNDSDLTQFLINIPENIKDYNIITINATPESEMTGDLVLNYIKEQNSLDTKLNVVLGDEYSQKVQNFIQMFKELVPKQPWDKTQIRTSAQKVLSELETTNPNKEDFSKVIKKHSKYILYCVSNTVEWYKMVLSLYGFKKLAETCDYEYIDTVTRGSRWNGQRTPDIMIKNFEKAKKL